MLFQAQLIMELQGENALYTATVSKDDNDFYTAFQVVPPSGYQKSFLTFTISSPDKLDFETDPWKKINTEVSFL